MKSSKLSRFGVRMCTFSSMMPFLSFITVSVLTPLLMTVCVVILVPNRLVVVPTGYTIWPNYRASGGWLDSAESSVAKSIAAETAKAAEPVGSSVSKIAEATKTSKPITESRPWSSETLTEALAKVVASAKSRSKRVEIVAKTRKGVEETERLVNLLEKMFEDAFRIMEASNINSFISVCIILTPLFRVACGTLEGRQIGTY